VNTRKYAVIIAREPQPLLYHIVVSDYAADGSRFYHVLGPVPPDEVTKGHFKADDEKAWMVELARRWHPGAKRIAVEDRDLATPDHPPDQEP